MFLGGVFVPWNISKFSVWSFPQSWVDFVIGDDFTCRRNEWKACMFICSGDHKHQPLHPAGGGEGYSVSRSVGIMCHWHCESLTLFNPFTPESDRCQNSPAASQEIWHHTVWRTWLFIAYSDEKWLYYKFSLHHSYNRFLKGWENTLFELRSERVKRAISWLWYPAQEYLCWFRTLWTSK